MESINNIQKIINERAAKKLKANINNIKLEDHQAFRCGFDNKDKENILKCTETWDVIVFLRELMFKHHIEKAIDNETAHFVKQVDSLQDQINELYDGMPQ